MIGDRIARPGHGHHDGVFHHRDTHIEVGSSASDEKPRLKWIHLEFPNLGCSSVVVRRKHRSALRENALQALADSHAAHLLGPTNCSQALAIDEMVRHERALVVRQIGDE